MSRVRDQDLKKRLIANHELTFQMTLDEACATELAALSIAELPRGHSPPKVGDSAAVNEIEFPDSEADDEASVYRLSETSNKSAGLGYTTSHRNECLSCGGNRQKASCKFRDAVCHRCGRRGHIERVCWSMQLQPIAHPQRSMERRQPPRQPKNQFQNYRGSDVHIVGHSDKLMRQKIHLNIHIEGKPCLMEVDTGSATSLVSWSTIKRLVVKGN